LYVDVVLPLPLRQFFTYSVPSNYISELAVGKRVVVPFGKSKLYSAIVVHIHKEKPAWYETKDIAYVLDRYPVVTEQQIQWWKWLASYYMTSVSDIYKAALPIGLRLESEAMVSLVSKLSKEEINELGATEQDLISLLNQKENISINDLSKLLNKKRILPIIKRLQEQGILLLNEKIKQSYKPKYETYVQLSSEYSSQKEVAEIFNSFRKSPKQEDLLMAYLSLSRCFSDKKQEISKKHLLEKAQAGASILSALEKKGILCTYKVEIGRLNNELKKTVPKALLSTHQKEKLQEIEVSFKEKDTVLLHGVTASGKTELYIHLIEKTIKEGKTVLYLLPEIALTSQIINRLRSVFGNTVAVYHSKFNSNEKVEIWNDLLKKEQSKYKIILGVRSSIFLPFYNLGLIVVDEEHENTFKQFDPSPRYQARDAAIVLAKSFKAKVLLGTATPSIESYYNATIGKYALVELNKKHKNIEPASIKIVDLKKARHQKKMQSHFSRQLLDAMQETLDAKKQVILFQNRRGYSPYIECETCGWIPQCEHCNVNLTYHKYNNFLKCHYCGYTISSPQQCLACGSPSIKSQGFGTQKVEDEIKEIFPNYVSKRLDLDTTRNKQAADELLYKFDKQEINILIGTQIITKGLDFKNVGLVGILNADNLINYPDFRSEERSFQLMLQVSGRAGREDDKGLVILQTSQVQHPIIKEVVDSNYLQMFNRQIQERKEFSYPPFVRLIEITIKHKIENNCIQAAQLLTQELRSYLSHLSIMGPQAPIINRIQNMYLQTILIKLPKSKDLPIFKKQIQERIDAVQTQAKFRSTRFLVNVDPF